MKTRVNICFIARKKDRAGNRQEKTAATPIVIVCRITVHGQKTRAIFHTAHETTYGNWDAGRGMGRVKGRGQADRHINEQLIKLRDQLTDIWADLERQGRPVTAGAIYRAYQVNGSTLDMLSLYDAFVAERAGLVGVEIAKGSLKVAQARRGKLEDFLTEKKLQGLRPEEFTHNMADKFLFWALQERGYKRSYANKMLQTLSQALRWAVRREYLIKNPMELYQYKMQAAGEIKYLTVGEMGMLRAAQLPDKLARVRDCFIFQCWTGLAYADLAALNIARDAEYHTDNAGILRRLLRVTRQKSTMMKGYECVIPLLPESERLLSQYGDELPVPTNQIYNRFLKEIGGHVGLPADKMTSHVGRKTAGVMMLNLGIRMEVVSKFLGHSSVRMTEKVYAKILDNTLVNDFSRVFGGAQAARPVYELETGAVQVVGHAPRRLPPAPKGRKAKRATPKPTAVAVVQETTPTPTPAKRLPAPEADPFGLLEMRQRWA